MAESVDALVSNTSGATHPGSIPGLGTKKENQKWFSFFCVLENGCWLMAVGDWQMADNEKRRTNHGGGDNTYYSLSRNLNLDISGFS